MTRFIGPQAQSQAQPAAPALRPPAAPLPLPQWDDPAPDEHDHAAHREPPSWLTGAAPAVLEAKIRDDLSGVLRVMLGRALLDQTAEQSWHRTDRQQVPPLGRLFLDSLDHLPVSARSRQRVLDGAVHKPDLPDWVRLQVAQAAVQARRVDVPRTLLTIRAIQNRRDQQPDHVSDFGLALGSRVVDTVVGLYSLVKFVAWDITAFRMVVDPRGYAQMVVNTGQTLGALRENPGLIWDALTRDVREAWQKGEYGKALGYLTFDVGTAVVGVPGAARAAAAVPGKMRVVIAVARDSAGQIRTTVKQVGDDLARGMELSAQDMAGGRVATAGAIPQRGTSAARPPAAATRDQATGVGSAGSPARVRAAGASDGLQQLDKAAKALLGRLPGNWPDVRGLIGKPLDISTLPSGYRIDGEGQWRVIHRQAADNNRFAPLTIDPEGKVQLLDPRRLSNATRMKANYKKGYGAISKNHWIHHLIPDNVMRRTRLGEILRLYGYDLDRAENLLAMRNQEAHLQDLTTHPDVIGHWENHPAYDLAVMEEMDDIYRSMVKKYGDLKKINGEQQADLMNRVKKLELDLRMKIQDSQFQKKENGTLASSPSSEFDV